MFATASENKHDTRRRLQQDMTRRWTTNDVLNQNSAKGWIALPESAPAWVRTYVAEARSAVLEKREIKPNLQREFIRGS